MAQSFEHPHSPKFIINYKNEKIAILLLSVVSSSCTDILGIFGNSEMAVSITNNSEMTIQKAGFYAEHGTQVFVDSFIVENILVGSSKQLIARRAVNSWAVMVALRYF